MEWSAKLTAFLTDERLLINLVALHGTLLFVWLASLVVRAIVRMGGQRILSWFGVSWLRGVTEEAAGAAQNAITFATLTIMGGAVVGGVAYHFLGRDVRVDGAEIWEKVFTPEGLVDLGFLAGKLCAIVVGAWFACRLVHRLRTRLEGSATAILPENVDVDSADSTINDAATPGEAPAELPAMAPDANIRRWFNLLERFAVILILLGATWLGSKIAHASAVERFVEFVLPIVSVALVARLVMLSANTLSRGLANVGDRHLSGQKCRHYWERAKRLLPFGERCFEAVVAVFAGASIVEHLGLHIEAVQNYSGRLIACIGIFFGTRIVIELLHVLVHEAFGMAHGRRQVDQKGLTLVPLLQSTIQYVLYFGSGVVMLEVMGGPTNTILAGAGLLGLAVGLGAQSLVSDVVSGFFILFEGQYLVGDIVQIGDANGRVEVVSIRHTQIRDEQGKIHIIPNGQIKSVTNFSKDWVNAVVDIKAPTTTSLDGLIRDMTEAGRRLKASRKEVLAETVIKGLVDLSPGDMTVRAITKVMPGTHAAMQCEYRRILKDVFDQKGAKAAA
jgi:small-conductance mechanosensitive channel